MLLVVFPSDVISGEKAPTSREHTLKPLGYVVAALVASQVIEPIENFTALSHGAYVVALMSISFTHRPHISKCANFWREI